MRLVIPALAAPALLAATVLAIAAAGCGGDDDEGDRREGARTTAAEASTTPSAPGCTEAVEPEPKPEGTLTAPTAILDDQTYRAIVSTSCGTFTITLDQQASPTTVASFVALAEDGFYDGTAFHRIVPGFVIQGGDPTGTGTGGPGYTTVDTPAPSTAYTFGTVAMAKAPDEPRGTAGSQFFVVTADDIQLPPDYAVIGTVTDGVEVVSRIGTLGDPNTELPTQPVVVESIRIERSA